MYSLRSISCLFTLQLVVWAIPQAFLAAQSSTTSPNIVPNPGFERFIAPPSGWTYSGSDFAKIVKYWFSGTTASPDIYGPGVKVPKDWAYKGFGKCKPHTGKCMAGITVYGCTDGKPHCREYLEIQLSEPLVIGQNYYLEFYVAPMTRSMHIDKLGAYFSISPINRTTDEILVRKPQMQWKEIAAAPAGQWMRVWGQFVPKYEAEHLLIGNFNTDDSTRAVAPDLNSYNYAYYYIDDVLLKKVPPIIVPPVKPDDLTRVKLEKGKVIRLKNIFFEFDKHELMPRSFVELKKLLSILNANPTMEIEIAGHTDSRGNDAYNLELSKRRAQSVVNYLTANNIAANRLRFKGEGEKKPIDSNLTDEGRAKNRRVEFVILKM